MIMLLKAIYFAGTDDLQNAWKCMEWIRFTLNEGTALPEDFRTEYLMVQANLFLIQGKLDSGISSIAHLGVSAPAPSVHTKGHIDKRSILTDAAIRQLERENMIEALRVCNGKIYGPRSASEKLGIKPTTLISRLKKMGITLDDWQGRN